ncbi:ornithine-acyl ACP N-acyltransferase [Tistrella bauzanensis]|uniref:L-ornithine N(alpha)-acyltransferase n=1 Tax=Tistrella bauzanensis TaxID=657419 RepID=A0ABQ1ICF9_9PROT|nr:GNAT family N-acyltransferase [Tistrella bauzanensis]GGB34540.1 ornithine-acyl ACP N-acyltransferase [Tistrella bauzanensis]
MTAILNPDLGLRSGNLRVCLADGADDIEAAQRLRYHVFYEERHAKPSPEMAAAKRDLDAFDDVCDHLLVIDDAHPSGRPTVVGTYRLLRRSAADVHGRFYTADEFDISPLLSVDGEVLELGRSCVAAEYRNRATMQLLWRGIALYLEHYDIQLMFGCASLDGTDIDTLKTQLAYLYHHHLAPEALRPVAVPERYVSMDLVAKDDLPVARALAQLPPLVKGYLRLGGFVGDGAVVDKQFNTTDICMIVKSDLITGRYRDRYEGGSGRVRPKVGDEGV